MGDHNTSPTCISAEPHGPTVDGPGAIADLTAHYFGCIRISERADFLDRNKNYQLWDHELHVELDKLQQKKPEMPKAKRKDIANDRIDEKIRGLAFNIEAQYKRTDILRKALSGVKCAFCRAEENSGKGHETSSPSEEPSCDLVSLAHHSYTEWRDSDRYKIGIEIIRRWKESKGDKPPINGHGNTRNGNDGSDSTTSDSKDMVNDREEVRNIIKKDHKDVEYAFKEDENTPYELERDTNGYIIQWEVLRPWEPQQSEKISKPLASSFPSVSLRPATLGVFDSTFPSSPRASVSTVPSEGQESQPKRRPWKPRSLSTNQPPSFYETHSGPEKYLKPVNESATDYRFKGLFPDQRATLQTLLSDDRPEKKGSDVILYRKRHVNEPRVRYLHIPHNNMKWVEEAIARYFHEESPTYDGIYRNPQVKTHSQMVLRPEYWRGQQHGGRRTLVHARHMRAICERISSNIWESEDNPDNIVLFMPFLHWEEDRKRDKMAKIIEQETERNREDREKAQNEAKRQRVAERTYRSAPGSRNLLQAEPQLRFQHPDKVDEAHHHIINSTWQKNSSGKPNGKHARNFAEFADGFISGGVIEDEHVKDGRKVWHVAKLARNEHGRVQTENKLGQFLLDAARLYEAISMYRDQQLVEKYLHHDPPLHPRRTLDQSYYWTLKSTKARDRDQVVYRGTTMDYRNIHRLCKRQEDQGHLRHLSNFLERKKSASIEAPEEREAESRMGLYKWDNHWERTDGNGCDHCKGEIRKVSRIVMVDQLWMWILDRQTIITSFPKRYGTNKSDPSGVHKSIRTRIKNARKNQIRSVFDVALIVLDECSNTFFDRTKTTDRHPQVMDIFAESIGSLQNKQRVSFQHLWRWTERASKIYNSTSKYEDTAHLHAPFLNINPEGRLQREIRDIIDELDIMIHVNNKQKEVIQRFVKNVENIYDPSGTWRDATLSPDGERDYLRSRSGSRMDDESCGKGGNRNPKSKREEQKLEREKDEFTWFRKQAYDLISDVGDRVTELEGLRKSAESTSQGVKDLLDLKQQQASILQAWQSVRQADESVRQGRSVMVFTIVTIIFLPLSFMSSVFGMNNKDIGETNMSFRDQANYMFPISASVILVSIVFAFWTYPRTVVWSAYKYSETWILVTFGIYGVFLRLKEWKKDLTTSDDLLNTLEKSVEKMKGEVKSRRGKKAAKSAANTRENCAKSGMM